MKRHLLLDIDNAKEDYDNLDHFISYILTQRVKLYEDDPRILRLIQWQALENQSELIGGNHFAPMEWIKVIGVMQER